MTKPTSSVKGIPPAPSKSKPPEKEDDADDSLELQIRRELSDRISGRQLNEVTERITAIAVREQFSGPLPHPRHLEAYERTLPGSAERILTMAEQNLSHNQKINETALDAEIRSERRGTRYGAILMALLILCALIAGYFGQNTTLAGLFLGAAALGVIPQFINGRGGSK